MKNTIFHKSGKVILGLMAILLVFGLVPFQTASALVIHTVAFDPDDGVATYGDFQKIRVPDGERVTQNVKTPQREGYIFRGWAHSFNEKDEPILWDFKTDTVTENTTLWAVWEAGYLVAFDPDDGVSTYNDFEVMVVQFGEKITEEANAVSRDNYIFKGWYYALDEHDNPLFWDFAKDTVTENTTLWAAWQEACTVAFDPDDGVSTYNDFEKITVGKGDIITAQVKIPVLKGYEFKGWYYALGEDDKPIFWDFEKQTVEENTTLWAAWEKGVAGEKEVTETPDPKPETKPEPEEKPQTEDKNPKTGDIGTGMFLVLMVSALALSGANIFRKKVK